MLPQFVTFTGLDEATDLKRARELQEKYPIEWALLFSPSRAGGRYCSPDFIANEPWKWLSNYAVHLCGQAGRWAMDWSKTRDSHIIRLTLKANRVQINARESSYSYEGLAAFSEYKPTIRQWRAMRFAQPKENNLFLLYDRSGGRGIAPDGWPEPPAGSPLEQISGRLVGYAGGFGPGNVRPFIDNFMSRFPTANYWIDMESRVRDENDRFDLDKCQQVCEEIWGVR